MRERRWYHDPLGPQLPLVLASIDRLDLAKHYEPGKVRLLLNGLNSSRRTARSSQIIDYIQQLQTFVAVICIEL